MATNEEALSTTDHEVAPAEAWMRSQPVTTSSRPGEASLANEGLRLAGLNPGERSSTSPPDRAA